MSLLQDIPLFYAVRCGHRLKKRREAFFAVESKEGFCDVSRVREKLTMWRRDDYFTTFLPLRMKTP